MAKRRHGFATRLLGIRPEWLAWRMMRERCFKPTNQAYARYGGRGITVCDRWRDSFENFLADMGEKPSARHSLDRIDNNGSYTPENCRWATAMEQHRNKRTTRLVTYGGTTKMMSEWCREFGLNQTTVSTRLKRGCLIADAFRPVQRGRNRLQIIERQYIKRVED